MVHHTRLLFAVLTVFAVMSSFAEASVREFGAVGDGKTDDTTAIQRAIDSAPGRIDFPKGTYRLTRPVRVELARVGRIAIRGEAATLVMAGKGPALHVVGTHGGTADPSSVKEPVWQHENTPLVDGLVISGEHPEADGICVEGCMQPIVTRTVVRRCRHGLVLTGRNRNVIVSDCHFYDNHGVGLLLERLNLHQINVTNCHISYNTEGGIVVRGSEIRNFQIGTCDIEANMTPKGPPTANVLFDCREGSIREGAIIGCTIQHGKAPIGAANIRLLGESREKPHKVGFFSIGDNQISDCGVNIHLQNARGVNITGNTFFLGHQHNLLVENCSQIAIGPNVFDRNPDYPKGSRDGIEMIDCRDCTLTGMHLLGVQQPQGAVVLRRCRWINVTASMILDCDHCGLFMEGVEHCRVSGCLVRDERPTAGQPVALRLTSGRSNRLGDNLLAGRVETAPGVLAVEK